MRASAAAKAVLDRRTGSTLLYRGLLLVGIEISGTHDIASGLLLVCSGLESSSGAAWRASWFQESGRLRTH